MSVAALLAEAVREWGAPDAICADRWRDAELRDALADADVPMARLTLRAQGFKDGSEDVRAFRKAILDGMVTPETSLLLRAAMAEAVTVCDPSGNEKLAKSARAGGGPGRETTRRRRRSWPWRKAAGGKLAAVRPQAQAFGWWWLEQGAPRQPSLFGVGSAAVGAGAPPVL